MIDSMLQPSSLAEHVPFLTFPSDVIGLQGGDTQMED